VNEGFGTGYVAGILLTTFLFTLICLTSVCAEADHRRTRRSSAACAPSKVLSASNGVAVCADGRVYHWSEGYLVPVEKK
jgi:hypothetical protein